MKKQKEVGRKAWSRPEVRKMSAGSAEIRTNFGIDDGGVPASGANRS